MDSIEKIVRNIDTDSFFDSHYVIDSLIKDYSDDYLRFASQYADGQRPTLTVHQQIGHQIAKLEGHLVERQPNQSHSFNIHGNGGTCALWKRVNKPSL